MGAPQNTFAPLAKGSWQQGQRTLLLDHIVKGPPVVIHELFDNASMGMPWTPDGRDILASSQWPCGLS